MASDKARFYLERYAPELNEAERKGIFTHAEIQAIAAKRSDFEHLLNSRGGSRPADFARYAEYEINLDALRKKRCRRLGINSMKGYSGQRTVFFILDRGTKKFPGDLALWMQFIRFCQREKAHKKLAKVLTGALRLHPRHYGLWVLAAKWYAEEQGDVQAARGYMQRGLRFCQDKVELWLEYVKLEMVYLAKLAARRKVLGLDEERKEAQVEESEDILALPTVTAADFESDATKGLDEVDAAALQRLAKAPAYTGALPIAIFDAAMKQFNNSCETAERFFDLVATFNSVPAARAILQHFLAHLQTTALMSPEAILAEARLETFGIAATSVDFPTALGALLSRIKSGFSTLPEMHQAALAEKSIITLLPYACRSEELDEDVIVVVMASLNRWLKIIAADASRTKAKEVAVLVDAYKQGGRLTAQQVGDVVGVTKRENAMIAT
jgi:U3 small nucleolar RNA-associated protein 6